jgi:hypothetical protein
MSLCSV